MRSAAEGTESISPREHVNSLACEFTYRFDHYRLASSCRPAILSPQHIVIRLPNVNCGIVHIHVPLWAA
jgi:hypothetical protein